MMQLNEKHHAYMVLGFYRALSAYGERGLAAFVKGAQLYGESRGRRMAMRALRDSQPLDFVSYFAYGEWDSSPGAYDCTFVARRGYVDENVTRCPWAEVFASEEAKDCGHVYCAEIDRALVRGFNPALVLEVPTTQHYHSCCQFYFRDAGIKSDLFEEADARTAAAKGPVKREFAYHCADLWRNYCNLVLSVFGEEEGRSIIASVREYVIQKTSPEVMQTVDSYRDTDFTRLS